jgi:exodeoxyribonuclease VII large subunit
MEGAYTVRELTEAVQLALRSWLPDEVWVEGEVADLSRSGAGHVFFQLVEPRANGNGPSSACLSVTLLDGARQQVNAVLREAGGAMRITDGTRIRIRGRLELYAQKGRIQLRMSGIDPSYTLGLLLSERDRVLRALAAEDLLDRNGHLPFPALPLRVGLVTSRGSAAMADFVDELDRSRFAWRVRLVDVRVQGVGADRSIARALRLVARAGVDLVALVRGGGARTDLATFDSEHLARAIAALEVPVITGIGHEIDSSVADLVAHHSHKTPTACAAALVGRVREAHDRVDTARRAIAVAAVESPRREDRRLRVAAGELGRRGRHRLARAEQASDASEQRLCSDAKRAVSRSEARTASWTADLSTGSGRWLRRSDQLLDTLTARVAPLDPARVLARGWSMTLSPTGTVIRRAGDLRPGDEIVTVFSDGRTTSTVTRSPVVHSPDGREATQDPATEETAHGD